MDQPSDTQDSSRRKRKLNLWQACVVVTIFLIVISFTPLVIPENTAAPYLFGLPRTLWAGIAIYCVLVFITFVGTRAFPHKDDPEET